MSEQWKEIPGYGGYQASNHGRIRSTQFGEPFFLSATDGRVVVYLKQGKAKKRLCVTVASLVLLAFRGPKPEKMLALRYQGNDDRPRNVKWASRSEVYDFTQRKKPCDPPSTSCRSRSRA